LPGGFTFMKTYLTTTYIWLCLVFAGIAHAQGTLTLTFDEFLLVYGETDPIPNGYASLQWVNFYDMNPNNIYQGPFGSGYLNAVVSLNNVIWNASGNPAQISSSTPFSLDSAYMTAAWMDGLQIEVQGFIGSSMTYDNIYTINTDSPTLVAFNYLGVNQVTFIASGGTQHYAQGWGTEFAIDNMVVTVPEPNGISLLLLGIVCIGIISPLSHGKVCELLRYLYEPPNSRIGGKG